LSLNVQTKNLVTIVIPTFDNFDLLHQCVLSILENTHPKMFEILIMNNGAPKTLDLFNNKTNKIRVIDMGKNLGWEGGINAAIPEVKTDFIMLLNDDTFIPPNDPSWILKMLGEFRDPSVGAVGPSSNYIMQRQNMFWQGLPRRMDVHVLIGLCMLMKTKLFKKLGGLAPNLPGGDDLDLSIRIEDEGLKLRALREVFVFHHGAKTGRKVHGNYWDSETHQDKTNIELIKRNGFKKFQRCRYGNPKDSLPFRFQGLSADAEGDLIRSLVKDGKVADLGCGGSKTMESNIGVDVFPKGTKIPSLMVSQVPFISQADIVAMVDNLPFKDGELDCIISRHILEHLINPVINLKEWDRVLKPGGRLIIAVPDEDQVVGIPLNPEHVHAYTEDSLNDLIASVLPNFKKVLSQKANNGMSFVGVYDKGS